MNILMFAIIIIFYTGQVQANLASIVAEMATGKWYEIPGTSVRSVLVSENNALELEIQGNMGSKAVFVNWSSAAYDGKNWYFMGGGHRGYGGNEIYRFSLETLKWDRFTEPEPLAAWSENNPCPKPGLGPGATHTYDAVIWSPKDHRIHLFAHGWFCWYGNITGVAIEEVNVSWAFDPTTKRWKKLRMWPGTGGSGRTKTALDPLTQNVIFSNQIYHWVYDPIADIYSSRAAHRGSTDGTLTVNPVTREALIMDRLGFQIFLIDGRALGNATELVASGDDFEPYVWNSGVVFHDKLGLFVIWDGNTTLYTLNSETGEVKKYKHERGPTKKVVGIYGKFVYDKIHDVLVAYSNVDQGVWLYRFPDTGRITDTSPTRQ